jgi:uncharacterized repeat protein (TIGR03843 family)
MDTSKILHLLQTGTIEMEGLLPWSSNYSFLVHVHGADESVTAVYKPRQGERPLWDFPDGTLCQRETAAYHVSAGLGWHLVPPTVLRDGPHGIGSIQQFIPHDPECHYFTFEGSADFRHALQQIVLFDLIINNADRKGGHILIQNSENAKPTDRLWAIDHGVCFHEEYKLRTVVWEFAGQPIPDGLLADLSQYQARLRRDQFPNLQKLLSSAELLALEQRLNSIIRSQTFFIPGPGRHYPWPPV